jgi:hypothetical protein
VRQRRKAEVCRLRQIERNGVGEDTGDVGMYERPKIAQNAGAETLSTGAGRRAFRTRRSAPRATGWRRCRSPKASTKSGVSKSSMPTSC